MPIVTRNQFQATKSTTSTTKTSKKSVAAELSAPKSGWSAQSKANALKMNGMVFDKGPNAGGKLVAPKGFSLDVVDFKKEIKGTRADGFKFTGSFAGQQVSLTGPDGKKKVVADTTAEAAKGATAYDAGKKAAGVMSKSESKSFSGIGTAGKMMSMTHVNPPDTFMKPSVNRIETVDASTGKNVKLSDLLSKPQFESVVSQVNQHMGTLDSAYEMYGANADLLKNNFALTTDSKGKVEIHLAWESGVHAHAGKMAHFTFDAPTDEAFRSKIGL